MNSKLAVSSNSYRSESERLGVSLLQEVCTLALVFLLLSGCSTEAPVSPPSVTVEQQRVHQVRAGETLFSISKQYQVPVAVIVDANNLTNAEQIAVGDTLRIPGRMTTSDRAPVRGRMVPLGFAKSFVGALTWPCASKEISSRFGKRGGSFHEGLDIRARPGTPVYAAHDGKVIYSGKGLSGYGRLVAIRGDGIMTVYAHNSKNFVDKYEYVKRGDQIAESGESGDTTGPHLHFEVRLINQQGRYHAVDPMAFFP